MLRMLFDTPVFFVFLILVVLIYWRLEFRQQNVFLLLASYLFYGWWDWRFLLLMIASTTIDYLIAHAIAGAPSEARRKRLLMLSLIINFGNLGSLQVLQLLHRLVCAPVPGCWLHVSSTVLKSSFRRGSRSIRFRKSPTSSTSTTASLKPADSLIEYALFISLFPHLIAGPIQRPDHLLPQVQQPRLER